MIINVIEVLENIRLDFTVSRTGPALVPAGCVMDGSAVVFVAATLVIGVD